VKKGREGNRRGKEKKSKKWQGRGSKSRKGKRRQGSPLSIHISGYAADKDTYCLSLNAVAQLSVANTNTAQRLLASFL